MRLLVLIALQSTVLLHATTTTSVEPFTAREKAQGYSDRAILAKPHLRHRATIDAAELAERTPVRERFPRFDGWRVIAVAPGESIDAAVRRLRATGRYEFVEPDHIMRPAAVPNDPGYSTQWSLNNTSQSAGYIAGVDIKAPAAWDIINAAPDVIVAIVDTGINAQHEDIAGNLWRNPAPTIDDVNGISIVRGARSRDLTDEGGHGTLVAGIIGAVGNNGRGIAGVAWRVQLMILKYGGATGGSTSDAAACIDYAIAHGAQIINCSFGGEYSQTLFDAIRAARDAGIIVVCAAGNNGRNNDVTPFYPASNLLENVIAVGNSDAADLINASSNYGAIVELFAPGTSVPTLDYRSVSGVTPASGSSMAAPHVTGALALLKARFPSDTSRQLINRVMRGVDAKNAFSVKSLAGGRLNLLRAMTTTTNRPFNDDFANRPMLAGETLIVRGSNRDATIEAGEPAHAGQPANATLWWQWTAPRSGRVKLETHGSDHDTVLAVYSGTALASVSPVAVNDDDGAQPTSGITFAVQGGITYSIAVGSKGGAAGFTLLKFAMLPVNDDFADATVLAGQSAGASGNNRHATREAGEPLILGVDGRASVWHRWTAPRNGRFEISAFSEVFDTVLAVYTGGLRDGLALVSASDDTGTGEHASSNSRCTIQAVAGTTYQLQLDTKSSQTGDYTLSITDSLWQTGIGSVLGPALTLGGTGASVGRDGTIFASGNHPQTALNAFAPDGSFKWALRMGQNSDLVSGTVAFDGTIYVPEYGDKLCAINPDGTFRWTRQLGSHPNGQGITNVALAADGTLYARSGDGVLSALQPGDGTTKWRFAANAHWICPVVAPDGTIYQGSEDRVLYAIKPDGALKWRCDVGDQIFGTPAIDGQGNVYCATFGDRLFCVSAGGALRWSHNGSAGATLSPALSADGTTVYFGDTTGRIRALRTSDGALQWTYPTGSPFVRATPAVDTNGVLYIGNEGGKVYAIHRDGSLKRTWVTGGRIGTSPVIFGSTLYIVSEDRKLYAFDIGAFAAGGPWPQYRQNPRHSGRVDSEPLAITVPPRTVVVHPGNALTLSFVATGQGPFTYQWSKDGVAITGATAAAYVIGNAALADSGSYAVRVSGIQGSVLSAPAFVTVSPAGRLINLSVLTSLQGGGDSFTLGYVVGGAGTTGPKPLVIRAAGPALAALGVSNSHPDPKLELFTGTTKTGENDNWGGSVTLTTAMAAVGAFPFSAATSADAAVLTTVSSTDNSVAIFGRDTGAGMVLAEIYDATPHAEITGTTRRLVNVSVLKDIGDGLTVGFVIGGSTSKSVLVRAIGPTLGAAPFDLAGSVPDVRFELFAGETRIQSNDDWGGTAALRSAFNAVGAFALPSNSRDAALVTTLEPGTYTVRVSPAGTASGVALVEVYEIP